MWNTEPILFSLVCMIITQKQVLKPKNISHILFQAGYNPDSPHAHWIKRLEL